MIKLKTFVHNNFPSPVSSKRSAMKLTRTTFFLGCLVGGLGAGNLPLLPNLCDVKSLLKLYLASFGSKCLYRPLGAVFVQPNF
jgi:hypothetical protein